MDCFIREFTRKGYVLAALVGMMLLVQSGMALALGIGSIKLDSSLDQPLAAEIEILGIQGNELDSLSISLASPDVYERMGIERIDLLELLKFRVVQKEDGNHVIRVYTVEAVSEPFLNFLIEINWASGRLLREFTVLLDPPLFGEETASPVESPDISAPPEVFAPGSAAVADSIPAKTPPPVISVAKDLSASSTGAGEIEYGKIKRGENLWKIANQLRDGDVSVEQMMLALYRDNPQAFYGNNISMLKEGAVLRLDSQDKARSISNKKALADVARQNADWLAYRRERQAARAVAAESATRTPAGMEAGESLITGELPSEQPLLQLVTPDPEQLDGAESGGTAGEGEILQTKVNSLKIELAMANEVLEATRKENSDLRGRISALETQINSINSLIELRDQELGAVGTPAVAVDGHDSIGTSLDLSLDAESDAAQSFTSKAPKAERPLPEKSIWDDPLTIATIVGLALIPAIAALVFGRRRKNNAEVESKEASFAEAPVFAVDDVSEFQEQQSALEANVELNALTDLGFADSEPESGEQHVIDPLSESDVYLAYGKYDKAEELLKSAIEADPDRQELKLKLLEVYSLSGSQSDFDERAEELYAAIGGDVSHPLWIKASEYGRSVSPGNTLFEKTVSNIEVEEEVVDDIVDIANMPSELTPLDADEESRHSKALVEEVEGPSEFEIAENPQDQGLPAIEWPPETVTEIVEKDIPEPDTEFVSVGYSGSSAARSRFETKLDEDELADLDIVSAPTEFEAVPDVDEGIDTVASKQLQTIPAVDDEDELVSDVFADTRSSTVKEKSAFDETSMFLLDDEVGTKLDLARAYIEMGDKQGARELLQEVQQEGDERQKQDARVLMSLAS